jgi:hypothetical protein
MVTESWEETTLEQDAAAQIRQEIVHILPLLKRAFTMYEKDEALKQNPELWIAYIEDVLKTAHKLLASRKSYPELEEDFARLETTSATAEERMQKYRQIKGLSEST